MASLDLRNKTYRVVFWCQGGKDSDSLDTGDRSTAQGLLGGVEKSHAGGARGGSGILSEADPGACRGVAA